MQESLQRTQSVEEIERLSEKGDNEKVVELLLQTFEQPKDKPKVTLFTILKAPGLYFCPFSWEIKTEVLSQRAVKTKTTYQPFN